MTGTVEQQGAVLGIAYVGILVEDLQEAGRRLEAIGLIPGQSNFHPGLNCQMTVFGTDNGGLALLQPVPGSLQADHLALHGGGAYHVALRTADIARWIGVHGFTVIDGPEGPAVFYRADSGLVFEITEFDGTANVPTPFARIESIPYAVAKRHAVADEIVQRLGLERSLEFSDLYFPDVQSTNSLLFAGPHAYLDITEGTSAQSPIRRAADRHGNSIFGVVLQPHSLAEVAKALDVASVPTVAPEPFHLRVEWKDGAVGPAAEVIAIDRTFACGARLFLNVPTFPW
jgi:catechol 2,3-dioxygenase-like lactoylglutathione lyase family enzyme